METRLIRIRIENFGGIVDQSLELEDAENGLPHECEKLLGHITRGETIPFSFADCIGDKAPTAQVCTEYHLRPFEEDGATAYEVRYEFSLALESEEEARSAKGRPRQPYLSQERLTYIEERAGDRRHRRKAFDTFGVGKYDGIHPEPVMQAMARNRWEKASISATRLLAERLGRSFFFFADFEKFARRTAHMRPGAFFLRALRNYWQPAPNA